MTKATEERADSARGSGDGDARAAEQYVYGFGEGRADGNARMREILGGKGAGLAEMSNAGVPVPPGFTIATTVCRWFLAHDRTLPPGFESQQQAALDRLQESMEKRLGDADDPLLVSVRSGAKFSMPGMMDTILNLGLNRASLEGLARRSGSDRFAWDCYRRFLQMFGSVVMGLEKHEFEEILDGLKKRRRVRFDPDLEAKDLQWLSAQFETLVRRRAGRPFPEDPLEQLALARDAVFRSWNNERAIYYRRQNGIPDDLGTAVNVQAMVFGNLGPTSGTGVGFTRNPATGENHFYGEYLANAQGEDLVAGVRTPEPISVLEEALPEVYRQLREITGRLETHYRDVQDFEFTVQEGRLFLLQTRTGKRTASAAVRIAVDMVEEGLITREEAIMRVEPASLDQLLHPRVDPKAKVTVLATGLAASPGAAAGRVVLDADTAAAQGKKEKVILVRKETTPDDIHGMDAAQGILTSTGGLTCIAGETWLLTDQGFTTASGLFERIERGERPRLLSFDSARLEPTWRSVVAAGRKPADVVTAAVSQTGRAAHNTLRITRDHKMYVLEDRALVKKPLQDVLNDGDFALALDRIPALEEAECSSELAYVAGALFSDGHVNVRGTKGRVQFIQKPTPEKALFIAAVDERFERALGHPFTYVKSRHTVATLRGRVIEGDVEDRICSRRAPAERLLEIRSGADRWVLGLDRERLLDYLAGYLDGDGSFSEKSSSTRIQATVSRANERLLQSLVLACLRLGILPQVSVNRDAFLLQITEQVAELLQRTRRLRGEAATRSYSNKCLSIRGLFHEVTDDVNFMGRIRQGHKRNLMFGVDKLRRDVLPLCRGQAKIDLASLLGSPLRSHRIDICHGNQASTVYNFEVDAETELDKNFIVFTSHYTPVLVSNSHAAVVARGMGKPCVCGTAEVKVEESRGRFVAGGVTVKEGDWITIDGGTGRVMLGQVPTLDAELRDEFATFMGWSDAFRKLRVRANADVPRDAKKAREFGAEGIGLCRTEHMFFAKERLPHVVAMIMAAPRVKELERRLEALEHQEGSPAEARTNKDEIRRLKKELEGPRKAYRGSLAKLLPFQRSDFRGLFQAMSGYPVTIRTLDPPLHEFLPKREELMVEVGVLTADWERARKRNRKAPKPAKLSRLQNLLHRVEELHEFNPMLGHRGCRLGITYPEITEMQARAIFEAACDVARAGGEAIPEIMIPLVGHVNELRDQAALVRRVASEVMEKRGEKVKYLVGTMIEVPRAAVTAGQVAGEAEFFSFGTNDLTQMTFGFSRDDAGKFLGEYVGRKILEHDPFVSIDQDGVGSLMNTAVARGRDARPGLKVGICGEHGGDPASVEFCHRSGLDYVSCSPFRVPIARLAAAQAELRGKATGSDQR